MVRWKGKDGFKQFLEDCEDTRFEPSVSFSTEQQWNDQVKDQKSKIEIVCTSCNYAASTSIGNFHFKKNAGCNCFGSRSLLKTESSRLMLIDLLSKSRFDAVDPIDQIAWKEARTTNTTFMRIKCRACKYIACSELKVFIRNKFNSPCWCTSVTPPYSSDEGRLRILDLLEESRFIPIGALLDKKEWEKGSFGAFSNLPLKCTVCDTIPENCQLSNFVRTKGALCWCSKSRPYCDENGRQQVLRIAYGTQYEPKGWMLDADEWKARNMDANSKLLLQCTFCHYSSSSTSIAQFVRSKSTVCDCKWKTQATVCRWLEMHATALQVEIKREYKFPGNLSKCGSDMPYDVAVLKDGKVILLFEVDGPQHFDDIWDNERKFNRTVNNDLDKEVYAIENGIPIARLYQPDVWSESFQWRPAVLEGIELAMAGKLKATVYRHPGVQAYTTGVYSRIREGTCVQVSM